MAAPTVWGFTGVAGVTKTFPIEGTNLYGVDIAGTLTPKAFTLGPNMNVILTAAKTDAELVAAMQEFIRNFAGRHATGNSGGFPVQAGTRQASASLTTTS